MKYLFPFFIALFLSSCNDEDPVIFNQLNDEIKVFGLRDKGCRIKKISTTNKNYSVFREFTYNTNGGIERISSGNNNYTQFHYNDNGQIDSVTFGYSQDIYLILQWKDELPAKKETYLADTLHSITNYIFDDHQLLKEVELVQAYNNEELSRKFIYYFDDNQNMIGWKVEGIFYLDKVFLRYDKLKNYRKLIGFEFLVLDLYSEATQCFSSNNILYSDDKEYQRKYTYLYNTSGYPILVKEFGIEASISIEYENCN